MRRMLAACLLSCLAASPVRADGFQRVTTKSEFLSLVRDRELWLGLFRIRLTLSDDGRIDGQALGWPVTGSWNWNGGYFCREMDWSGTAIPFTCQRVEVRDGSELRFTVDQGAGRSASFRLR